MRRAHLGGPPSQSIESSGEGLTTRQRISGSELTSDPRMRNRAQNLYKEDHMNTQVAVGTLAAVSAAVQRAASEAAAYHLGPEADQAEIDALAAEAVAAVQRREPQSPDPGKRTIRIAEDLSISIGAIWVDAGLELQETAYGWHINEAGWPEWEITFLFTSRQDGNVSWLVALTDVDGSVKHLRGLTPWSTASEAMGNAVMALTSMWIEPITVEITR